MTESVSHKKMEAYFLLKRRKFELIDGDSGEGIGVLKFACSDL